MQPEQQRRTKERNFYLRSNWCSRPTASWAAHHQDGLEWNISRWNPAAEKRERPTTSHGPRCNKAQKSENEEVKLDPFIDENGLLQVGGWIRLSSLCYDAQHLIILPKEGHVTDLILCHFHQSVKHQGRGVTQNEIRSAGFWIIGGSSVVSHHISKCVSCRRLGG